MSKKSLTTRRSATPGRISGLSVRLAQICLLTGSLLSAALFAADTVPDFTGSWLPLPERAEGWSWQDLPLTAEGQQALRDFDPSRHDSVLYCMPMGTPRNTLNTAPYPMEILQTADRLVMIFPQRQDVRRIFLDGRKQPEDPIPGWSGHSVGNFNKGNLRVDTIGLTAESLIDARGLRHSDAMQVSEDFTMLNENGSTLLQITMTITDPEAFTEPLQASRTFRRIEYVESGETAPHCLMDQWRRYLEQHNSELSRSLRATGGEDQQ